MHLSIVIPAFNAEEYLGECLNSLLQQGLAPEKYEVLVIDDGSTDSTAKLVQNYHKDHPHIKLIQQSNQGNGAARNTGLKKAVGTYLYFIDADDYLASGALSPLLQLAISKDLDILGFGTSRVNDGNQLSAIPAEADLSSPLIEDGMSFIGHHNYEAEVWWYFSKLSFLREHGFQFFDRRFIQDSFLTPTHFSKAKRVCYVNWNIHRYRMSANSITRTRTPEHFRKHFGDMVFAVGRLTGRINELAQDYAEDHPAMQRLKVKQERYVFILIIRFIRSGLPVREITPMIAEFKKLGAYPMKKFMSLPDYQSPKYKRYTLFFNQEWLLKPVIYLMRILKIS